MSEKCYNKEYAHPMDDCGSMCCELTGLKWNEWATIDEEPCDCCPNAASYDDDDEEGED